MMTKMPKKQDNGRINCGKKEIMYAKETNNYQYALGM